MRAENSDEVSAQSPSCNQISLASLTANDIDAVVALFEEVKRLVPAGHLAERSREDLLHVICDPSTSVSVGAWKGGHLIAYSLCSRDAEDTYSDVPLVRLLRDRGETLWTGKGTIVRPDSEGQLLMPRLLKARGALIKSRGIAHSAGLIAVDNIPSLAGAFRAGASIIGLVHDGHCQNFLCYGGELVDELTLQDGDCAEIDDLGRIADLISRRWIGTNMSKDAQSGLRVLKFRYCFAAVDSRGGVL